MRIQINLSEEILEKVEQESQRIGVSRGSMISTWIGEKINSLETSRSMLKDVLNDPLMRDILENSIRKEQENSK